MYKIVNGSFSNTLIQKPYYTSFSPHWTPRLCPTQSDNRIHHAGERYGAAFVRLMCIQTTLLIFRCQLIRCSHASVHIFGHGRKKGRNDVQIHQSYSSSTAPIFFIMHHTCVNGVSTYFITSSSNLPSHYKG